MTEKALPRGVTHAVAVGALASAALALTVDNYLLFHTFAELLVAAIALVVFSVAWHTRRIASSDYLTVVGMSALPVALVTILHAMAYRGMPIFPGYGADLPTQLWLVARVLQASAFVLAPLFLLRPLRRPGLLLGGYCFAAALATFAAFAGLMPPAFVEGQGLTPFKVGVEYLVIAATGMGALGLWVNREHVGRSVRGLLWASMGATIAAEVAFTLYADPTGPMNRLGHAAHLTAFLLIYLALVDSSLETPLTSLFGQLTARQRELAIAYENEHLVAETLQNAIAVQPKSVLGLDVAHYYLPAPGAGRIGGDFYDLFPLDSNSVGFVIGDVCGKGLRAAATTLKARSAIRAIALSEQEPVRVLESVNSYLLRELEDDAFVTVVYGIIDIRTGEARMAIAGHPDPVVCGRAAETPPETARSQPLGIAEPLGVGEWRLQLAPGESLALVTDGIIDAKGRGGRFGSERLHDLLRDLRCGESAEAVASSVVDALRRHAEAGLDDDMAVIALRFQPSDA